MTKKRIDYRFCVVYLLLHLQFSFFFRLKKSKKNKEKTKGMMMEFGKDTLRPLADGEFYATPRHVGRVQGGIANYVLQQHRLETRRKTGKNITFEEKDQAVVLSAVGRWKHPGLAAAANDVAKDMGFLVEEADRFATWSILKRLEEGKPCLRCTPMKNSFMA